MGVHRRQWRHSFDLQAALPLAFNFASASWCIIKIGPWSSQSVERRLQKDLLASRTHLGVPDGVMWVLGWPTERNIGKYADGLKNHHSEIGCVPKSPDVILCTCFKKHDKSSDWIREVLSGYSALTLNTEKGPKYWSDFSRPLVTQNFMCIPNKDPLNPCAFLAHFAF